MSSYGLNSRQDLSEKGAAEDGDGKKGGCCHNVSNTTLAVYIILAVIGIVLVLVLSIYFGVHHSMTEEAPPPTDKSNLGVYRHAAVAADNYRCSQIGNDILRQGGSAVDSTIAALLCDGLYNMQSMGIGGGFFMTYYDRATQTATIIDARESAPALATEDMYVNQTGRPSIHGGKAIGVPGELRGYAEAHRRWGKLPWRDLFTATIRMCREGFPISRALSKAMHFMTGRGACTNTAWNMNKVFYKEVDGTLTPRQEGDLMKLPELADTLEAIAAKGAEEFYTGDMAHKIINDIQSVGGILTLQDLQDYQVKVKEPLKVSLDDHTIYSPPPPASGAVLQLILNILDGYEFSPADISTPEKKALTYHRIVEAFKFGYAKRSALGDEDYVNVTELVSNMTSETYANDLRLLITDNHTHNISYYGPSFSLTPDHGTGHISVLAENGDAVAVTSTINTYFGSCIRSPLTGIIFNNEMDDFSTPGTSNTFGIPASPTNFISPGKRPMSSMSPSVLTDPQGNALIVIGSSGGSKITTAVAYTLIHDFWLGFKINEAIDQHRLHHQLAPNLLQYESAFNESFHATLEILHRDKGHALGLMSDFSTAVQGISVDDQHHPNRTIYAYSDQRKGGLTDGY